MTKSEEVLPQFKCVYMCVCVCFSQNFQRLEWKVGERWVKGALGGTDSKYLMKRMDEQVISNKWKRGTYIEIPS